MIRLAVDAREYSSPNRLTGIGRFLTNIVAPLAVGPEFEFVLFTLAPDAVPSRLLHLPGVRVERLPRTPHPFFQDQFVLPRAARAVGADLFFSPTFTGPWFPGMPMIITVHDIMLLRVPAVSPLRRLLTLFQIWSSIRRCQKVITVSKFTERDLVDIFPAAGDKTVVMYSDIGADWFRLLTDHSATPAPAVSPTTFAPFFLYVGTFRPHKNVDLLIRGFHAAVSSGRLPRHCLVLIGGDDDNTDRVMRLIRKLELGKRVYVCRDVDDFSLSRFYHAADWFITASQYEGYGYPPVEAMIAGCPVVCHPVTSLIEVVGSAALPITTLQELEIARALAQAAEMGAADRQKLIDAGNRQCRLFTPGQTADAFARLVRSLVATSG